MTIATEQMIREMAAVVVREAQPDAIIPFGSHAVGSAGPGSDVDLMVVEQGPFGLAKDRRREMTRLWRALAGFDEAQHLLVAARKDWNALHGMTDSEVFADEIFGFHAQQAVLRPEPDHR